MSVGGWVPWHALLSAVIGVQLFAGCWILSKPRGSGWPAVGLPRSVPADDRGGAAVRQPVWRRRPEGSEDDHPKTALTLELIAAMLESGSSLQRALRIVAQALGPANGPAGRTATALELGVPWDQAWRSALGDRQGAELRQALDFAAASGAPSAELISARARMLRRRRHQELERRAAALGVRLVVPLGVCSLPAFLCLGVVPVLLSMGP
ncbi:type II secretion system F family protein [Sinomonas susongensis]|uniref:type II secretion system F family protein n=1 Tax=Sinomonas susongensis TaxID=1324851 RepID=UPI0014864C71|nr:type II secretion system F family protein [Sinomonas susongensis]